MKKVPIIALCTLIIANCGNAAKLCAKIGPGDPLQSAFTYCARETLGQCTMGYIVAGDGCDAGTQWCTNTQYIFAVTLSSSATNALAAPDLTTATNNHSIWCKLVWPYSGDWVYIYSNPTSSSGLTDCRVAITGGSLYNVPRMQKLLTASAN